MGIIESIISFFAPIAKTLIGMAISLFSRLLYTLVEKVGSWIIDKIENKILKTNKPEKQKTYEILYLTTGEEDYLDAAREVSNFHNNRFGQRRY